MKCQKCNGDGKERNYFGVIIGICPRCYGTGEAQPITNEEFLRTATTEQLAEAIYYLTWFHTELDERLDKNVKNGCYNDDENIKIVMEWLKQPHTIKE